MPLVALAMLAGTLPHQKRLVCGSAMPLRLSLTLPVRLQIVCLQLGCEGTVRRLTSPQSWRMGVCKPSPSQGRLALLGLTMALIVASGVAVASNHGDTYTGC